MPTIEKEICDGFITCFNDPEEEGATITFEHNVDEISLSKDECRELFNFLKQVLKK
jgi:hypothetical protein